MKDDKLNRIFQTARSEPVPDTPAGFESDVMCAIRSEPQGRGDLSLFDALGHLFPRLAWVAALVILLCVMADYGLATSGGPDVDEGVAQVSDHWLFTSEGL